MARSRRCCCCQKLYTGGGTTALLGKSVSAGVLQPFGNLAPATLAYTFDHANKQLFFKTSVGLTQGIGRVNAELTQAGVFMPTPVPVSFDMSRDAQRSRLFYSDTSGFWTGEIRRIDYDGGNPTVLVPGTINPATESAVLYSCLAFERLRNKLFYARNLNRAVDQWAICCVSGDGGAESVLYSFDSNVPFAIWDLCVDHTHLKIWWIERPATTFTHVIRRMDFDGGNVETVYSGAYLATLQWSHHLQRLFYFEALTDADFGPAPRYGLVSNDFAFADFQHLASSPVFLHHMKLGCGLETLGENTLA